MPPMQKTTEQYYGEYMVEGMRLRRIAIADCERAQELGNLIDAEKHYQGHKDVAELRDQEDRRKREQAMILGIDHDQIAGEGLSGALADADKPGDVPVIVRKERDREAKDLGPSLSQAVSQSWHAVRAPDALSPYSTALWRSHIGAKNKRWWRGLSNERTGTPSFSRPSERDQQTGAEVGDSDLVASVRKRQEATMRTALHMWSLAARQFREARRLRPRSEEATRLLAECEREMRELKAHLGISVPRVCVRNLLPVETLISHFHLTIHHWDNGKAHLAKQQAKLAVALLKSQGLPLGCAEHSLTLINQVTGNGEMGARETEIMAALKRNPDSFRAKYLRGELLFDKRMLRVAEAAFRDCERSLGILYQAARSKHQTQMSQWMDEGGRQGKERGSVAASDKVLKGLPAEIRLDTLERRWDKKETELFNQMEGLREDLRFIAELRQMFCTSCPEGEMQTMREWGAEGDDAVRNAPAVHMLPCLLSRFQPDLSPDCRRWREELILAAPLPAQQPHHRCKTAGARVCGGRGSSFDGPLAVQEAHPHVGALPKSRPSTAVSLSWQQRNSKGLHKDGGGLIELR
uniref:Uncharacterized protein n=1 Tax=Chromera velia CCMP2878 TaxID=1169474 RepID=A0A0G4HCF7_9ALVE|eukprot:Cvel_26163.t1-p1 / transcript=Cvel_26163.t1 / gene=Cvel_26163 / organism=Chromera_velia_CCMP2878 / gene_product=hypothetical protein / transcript_product=hypothetical protein / location=Cvel_scaffold3072:15355-17085(+) / protein_length=577 / sequence_SO=supercontig / SO=protein_coding / is_pseudo=false